MNPSEPSKNWRASLPSTLFIAGVTLLSLWLGWVKMDALHSWRYSSDLFEYDMMLAETLRGNLALEYTYGNHMGDHFLMILALLIPFKILLGAKMPYLLVILPVLLFWLGSMQLFYYLRERLGSLKQAALLCLPFMFSLHALLSIYEKIYGFQLDIISGYMGVMFVIYLDRYQRSKEANQANRKLFIAFVVTLALYVIMKEEMALLATAFFGFLWLFRRTKFHFITGAACGAFFVFSMVAIALCATEFNRGNATLTQGFIQGLRTDPLGLLQGIPPSYIIPLALLIALAAASYFVAPKAAPIPASLFLMGGLKLGFAFIIMDYSLTSWHNFPATLMMTAGIMLQLANGLSEGKRTASWILIWILLISSIPTTLTNLQEIKRQLNRTAGIKVILDERKQEIHELQEGIPKDKLVAINGYTAIEFTGGPRYTFYPRGVDYPPKGISDYILIEPEAIITRRPWFPYEQLTGITQSDFTTPHAEEFEFVKRTKHYVLLKRFAIKKEHEESREMFRKIHGPDSLGE